MPYDYGPNIPQPFQNFTPILMGLTDNPTVTYTKQFGRYWLRDSKFCNFTIAIITTAISKTTLTDAVLVQLPFTAANPDPDAVRIIPARMTNSFLSKTANTAEIAPNTKYLKLTQDGLNLLPIDINYTLLSIGSLTGTITIRANGVYEIA